MDNIKILPKNEEYIWRIFNGEFCPVCNAPALIYTSKKFDNGYAFDKDQAKCLSCGNTGKFIVDMPYIPNQIVWNKKKPNKIHWYDQVPSEVYVCLVFILLLITFGYTSYFFFKV